MHSGHIFCGIICSLIYGTVGQTQDDPIDKRVLTNSAMHFVINYLNWRRIDHVIIFDSSLQRGSISYEILQMFDCMSQQGIYVSIYSTHAQISRDTFRVNRHRLGILVLLKYNETIDYNHVLAKASNQRLFNEQHAWLLLFNKPREDDSIMNYLRTLHLGLTSDFVIAAPLHSFNETYKIPINSTCPIEIPKRKYVTDSFGTGVQIHQQPKSHTSEITREQRFYNENFFTRKMTKDKHTYNIFHFELPSKNVSDGLNFELIQIYKIRRDDENSLVFKNLGSWGPKTNFDKVKRFNSVEDRQDLMGFPLIVGFINWTAIKENSGGKSQTFDTEVDDTKNIMEIMSFIAKSLNATIQYIPYQALGQEIQEGVWSDLLNAVVKGDVDLGLEKVTVSYHKLNHMAFTHNILKMSHNIYMHPSEFSVSRDIYLTPFSPKLLLCVLGMAILLAIIMLIVASIANIRAKINNIQVEYINISYAALWIVGILSMQGSVWSPISSAGNMTLISSLMFSLIIYNSYAAFITSILSVKTSDINSLEDLFANGYKVGYIQNSQDEIYLQKETGELKNIYLRGYDSKVDNIEQGLLMAARTKYALFVSTQAARKEIQTLSPYECRCQIQEFVVRSTLTDVAFPLSKLSSYHKVVNLGVMRLIESGTLSRIQNLMMPDMPTCSSDSSFTSAQLEDVITAVELLGIGIVLAMVVGIGECVVKYRIGLARNIKQGVYTVGHKIKHTVENFEF